MGSLFAVVLVGACLSASGEPLALRWEVDPVTRYVNVSYGVPQAALNEIAAQCEVRIGDGGAWEKASVQPYLSETARNLYPQDRWNRAVRQGVVLERYAGGTRRIVVWNPFERVRGRAVVRFRVTLLDGQRELGRGETDVELDNADVVVIDDWSKVYQKQLVSGDPARGSAVWWVHKDAVPRGAGDGLMLDVKEKGIELPPLTYPLDLKGPHAVFVSVPPEPLSAIDLRLSGDDRSDTFTSGRPGLETFWRWADMTRQHLVIGQAYHTVGQFEENLRSRLRRVRLVPLSSETVRTLEKRWSRGGGRRLAVAYYEPYSWAFYQNVQSNVRHWESLEAFSQAGVDRIDMQIGRIGAKMYWECRASDQLLGETYGDDVRGKTPTTGNVGKMQQYTNLLSTSLRYAHMLGVPCQANLGANICYAGTPLESEFSRQHPDWRAGSFLKYDVPEVRRFVLSIFEDALQCGATSLALDWCRYPEGIDQAATVTGFFRELRKLADRYGQKSGQRIEILTRFPAHGESKAPLMDYRAWVREGLVDYLCPSRNAGNGLDLFGFDLAPYLEAIRGTKAKLLPDTYNAASLTPGLWLQRIGCMYEAGADGFYLYQADQAVFHPELRRYLPIAGSVESLKAWQQREAAEQNRYSKGIYRYGYGNGFYFWIEGTAAQCVEIREGDRLLKQLDGPPFTLDATPKAGIRVRAKDGAGWLEQEFAP